MAPGQPWRERSHWGVPDMSLLRRGGNLDTSTQSREVRLRAKTKPVSGSSIRRPRLTRPKAGAVALGGPRSEQPLCRSELMGDHSSSAGPFACTSSCVRVNCMGSSSAKPRRQALARPWPLAVSVVLLCHPLAYWPFAAQSSSPEQFVPSASRGDLCGLGGRGCPGFGVSWFAS